MALIGSIAINMSVRTAALVKGMKQAAGVVKDFGDKATASAKVVQYSFAEAGKAVASTVKTYIINPLMDAMRIYAAFGKTALHIGGVIAEGGMVAGRGPAKALMGMSRAMIGVGKFGVKAMRAVGRSTMWFASKVDGAVSSIINMKNALIFGIVGAGLFKMAKAASGFGEQMNRAGVTFGASASKITKQAEIMAIAFGTSRSEFLRSTSAMAGMFEAMGYTKDQSADLSLHFQKMAQDLASLIDVPVADALEKIESGLAGEVRPLREVGVFLSEAAIKEKALKMGIGETTGVLTDQQKVMVRMQLITEQLAYAQGDQAKTANSAANAARSIQGRFENLAATMGQTLLPLVVPVLEQIQYAIQALSMWWESSATAMIKDTTGFTDSVQGAGDKTNWFRQTIEWVVWGAQKIRLGFLGVRNIVTKIISGWVKITNAFVHGIGWVWEKLTGKKLDTTFIDAMVTTMEHAVAEEDKIFKKAWEEKDWSTGIGKGFEDAKKKIEEMRKAAMEPGKTLAEIGGPKIEEEKKGEGPKFAGAAAIGTKEAAEIMLRTRYATGLGGKDAGKQTAENTNKLVAQGMKMVDGMNKMVAAIKGGRSNLFGDAQERAMEGSF